MPEYSDGVAVVPLNDSDILDSYITANLWTVGKYGPVNLKEHPDALTVEYDDSIVVKSPLAYGATDEPEYAEDTLFAVLNNADYAKSKQFKTPYRVCESLFEGLDNAEYIETLLLL